MLSSKTLARHELIGLKVEVVESTNKSQIGAIGTVIDETRQTLTIELEKKKIASIQKPTERSYVKDQCSFRFTLPNGEKVRVDGKVLVARPEDRIKKKLKKW